MACDDHYYSDLPVFYKLIMSYLETRWEWCSRLVCDVLDTFLFCPLLSQTLDWHSEQCFHCHLSHSTITYHLSTSTICPSPVVPLPSHSNWSKFFYQQVHGHSQFVTTTCHRHVTQNKKILCVVDIHVDFKFFWHLANITTCWQHVDNISN